MTQPFPDHFSSRSAGYATFRPTYPAELFQWLADQCPGRELAWDCATGNGQAAVGLAAHFRRVVATDASAAQLEHATLLPNVEYRVARAEASDLADQSVDLVTVAQALHWLERPRFFAEVARVVRPGGAMAVWMYNLMSATPALDEVVRRFYRDVVGPYWPGDRVLVDSNYRSIEIPFAELAPPAFRMEAEWPFDRLVGYLRTWSASARYQEARGHDPVGLIEADLARAWGDLGAPRRIQWPLAVRVARVG